MTDSSRLELLQRANARFAGFFRRFSGTQEVDPNDELHALLRLHETLESVGALLNGPPQIATSNEVCQALDCYRENLVRLRRQLAIMQQSAMAQRESLDHRRDHLQGAKAWCAVSRAII